MVCDIDARVKVPEDFLVGKGQPVHVRPSCTNEKRLKRSGGGLSPNGSEFTPARRTVIALSLMGPLGRKKPQECDGKAFWEAYRAQCELLTARNGWNDQECAVQLTTNSKGVSLKVPV